MGINEKNRLKAFVGKINKVFGLIIDSFEIWTLVFCVAALTVLLITDFIARQFYQSIYFADEISRFLVIFVTFVGVSYGVRKARHIRMGAFLDMMNPRAEKIFLLIIFAVSAAVMFIMAYLSYGYLMFSLTVVQKTPALRLPSWIFYVIVPIGFSIAGLQYIRAIIKNLIEKETWMSPEQQSEYEEEII